MTDCRSDPPFDLDDFGINEGAIFDAVYPEPFPVGLNRSYPKDFTLRILAAAMSYKLNNNSIDYTRRRHLGDYEPEKKPHIRASIERLLNNTGYFTNAFFEGHREKSIGQQHAGLVLFDIYCFRAFDSIRAAAVLSNHGFFGETMSVLRYLVEQFAWLTGPFYSPTQIRFV